MAWWQSAVHDGNTIHILSQTGRTWHMVTQNTPSRWDLALWENSLHDEILRHIPTYVTITWQTTRVHLLKYLSRLHNFSLKETKHKNWQDRHDFLKIRAQCEASLLSACPSLFWVQYHLLQKKEDFECPGSNNLCLCVRSFFFFSFQVFCSQDINHPPIYDLGHPQVTHACIHAKSPSVVSDSVWF